MKNIVRILSLVLAAMMLCGMVGTVASAEGVVELTIPHYKTGENVGAVFFLPQVERFNKLYEGKYHITIEELTQDLYAEKMKQLGQQNALPALVEGGETEWIQNVVIPNGLYTDMSAFLADHADVAALLDDTALAYNTTEDNKVFSIPSPVVRPMGMFYNGALVDLGDKTAADLSWDEFAEKLGDNKIAFMTGENAWTTSLIFSSLIAVEEGGADLLRETYSTKIYDYNQPAILNAVTKLQALLQNYAASNTVGAVYADAANAFESNNAAVIANGSWMVSDFLPDGSANWSNGFDGSTVRGAVLPGNVALANTAGYGWWVPANVSDAEKEAAMAFIAFMNTPEELEAYMLAEGGVCQKLTVSEAYTAQAQENALMYEYVNAVNADTIICPAVCDCMPSSIANTEFGNLLPLLIDGTYTPEQFCQQLTTLAEETRLD